MSIHYRCALIAAPIVLSAVSSYAGPCSPEIDRMQSSVDAISVAIAASGPPARQTTAAMTHRQPTPSSIAEAEAKLAEEARAKRAMAALAQARAADRAGDNNTCQRALRDVRREIGQ
jgi:hypothetical protein